MGCPVLTCRMELSAYAHAARRPVLRYAVATRCPVLRSRMELRQTAKSKTRNRISAQVVPGMRFLVFDFAVQARREAGEWRHLAAAKDAEIARYLKSNRRNRVSGTNSTEKVVSYVRFCARNHIPGTNSADKVGSCVA
eukprot:850958-Rhodomonas_salina.5